MINKPRNYCKGCKKTVPKEYKACVKCFFRPRSHKE